MRIVGPVCGVAGMASSAAVTAILKSGMHRASWKYTAFEIPMVETDAADRTDH
jgi:hypothetical protein